MICSPYLSSFIQYGGSASVSLSHVSSSETSNSVLLVLSSPDLHAHVLGVFFKYLTVHATLFLIFTPWRLDQSTQPVFFSDLKYQTHHRQSLDSGSSVRFPAFILDTTLPLASPGFFKGLGLVPISSFSSRMFQTSGNRTRVALN